MYNHALVRYFPFKEIHQGANISLYGMGLVGHQFVAQIISTNYCTIHAAVDKNWKNMKPYMGVKISDPSVLKTDSDSLIIITIQDRKIVSDIYKELLNIGIEAKRIISAIETQYPCPVSYVIENKLLGKEFVDTEEYDIILQMHQCLKVATVPGKEMVRVGNPHDGGYMMLDDFSMGNIAYSFGINNDVSWDSAMVSKGYKVYMYDHTIDALPYEDTNFFFFRKGIADRINHSPELDSLDHYIVVNRHQGIDHMILKMDVEGAEWGALQMISSSILQQFDQIVLEVHGLCDLPNLPSKIRELRHVNQTHQLIHIHPNNYAKVLWINHKPFPDTLELTYVNKNNRKFISSDSVFPISSDAPCLENYPEIELGLWNDNKYYENC